MKKIVFYVWLFLTMGSVFAEVPSEMEFGGMELKLTDGVRKKLQADIDMITRSPKSFQLKVDRADLYFPIIEKIFKEEDLPEDFKFLSLQESSLIPDAVSTSNAVGYWQFKKETAIEVGLRVDHHVDERMNIVSSSRGAAKYLKKNNTVYFDNWVYALLAYNLGAGGAKSKVKDKYRGAKKMVIDEDMHWYVIRFLAHKLAYENAVGKNLNPAMVLVTYYDCKSKSLHDIAKETQTEVVQLEAYNKWLLKGHIPDDKEYYVILPVNATDKDKIIVRNTTPTSTGDPYPKETRKEGYEVKVRMDRGKKKRTEIELSGSGGVAFIISINGIKTIQAKEGDTPSRLALQGGISTGDFLKYNDLRSFEQIKAGQYYYLQPKRSKGIESYHIVQPGETIRDISQKHGIRIDAIRKKNRMSRNENVAAGRVLWLRRKRPEDVPVEYKKIEVPKKETQIEKPEPVVEKKDPILVADPIKESEPVVVKDSQATEPVTANEVVPFAKEEVHPEVNFHEVRQGETLYSISRMYSLSVDTLKSWNELYSNDIQLGQKLIVKKELRIHNESKNTSIEHIVQPGETLYQISKKYGVSIENIQAWNNKSDTKISLGERLIIKSGLNK